MDDSNLLKRHAVRVLGNPSAPRKMVFVHGFGTDQSAWKPVSRAFFPDYRVVLYDHAGAGSSSEEAFDPDRYAGLEAYAHDLLDVCTALDLRDAVLVGHSMGGMVAVLAALKRPELFSRLVLIGASARYLDDDDYRGGFTQADLDGLYAAMTSSYQAWVSGFAPLVMGGEVNAEPGADFAKTLGAIRPDVAQAVARSIFQSDHRKDVVRLHLPTLLLQTKRDVAVPREAAEFLHRSIAGSTLVEVNTAGHLPHLTAPRGVIAAMRSWLG